LLAVDFVLLSTVLSGNLVSPGAVGLPPSVPKETPDPGLAATVRIAGYYRIAVDAAELRHRLDLYGRLFDGEDRHQLR